MHNKIVNYLFSLAQVEVISYRFADTSYVFEMSTHQFTSNTKVVVGPHTLIYSTIMAKQHISKQGNILALRIQLICFPLVYRTTKRLNKICHR